MLCLIYCRECVYTYVLCPLKKVMFTPQFIYSLNTFIPQKLEGLYSAGGAFLKVGG